MPTPQALYLTEELRRIEQDALATLPPGTLMARAGEAAARQALLMLDASASDIPVLVLAGPGNNGGDALQAATLLRQAGVDVQTMLCPRNASRPADAQCAFEGAASANLPFLDANPQLVAKGRWRLVIDGLFGIGLTRALSGEYRALVEAVNGLDCPVLALDIPSGLDADTGMRAGDGDIAVRATHTITFIGAKPGLYTGHGRDCAGQVSVDTLGLPEHLFFPTRLSLNDTTAFAHALRPRLHYSHKGSYGDLRLIGGARGMVGALVLAARTALYGGAGRVFAGFLDTPPPYDDKQPELMCRLAEDLDFPTGAVVIGPGLGTSVAAAEQLRRILGSAAPSVLDADALNLLAADAGMRGALRDRQGPSLLTPHPLEAARVLGTDSAHVQADRVGAARRLAKECNAVVILKGSGSVIAAPDGMAFINPTGNPALATGGTGDVLAGLSGALLAQGLTVLEAALCGTWIHGRAADELVAGGAGPVGLTAGELAPAIRRVLNRLTAECAAGGPRRS